MPQIKQVGRDPWGNPIYARIMITKGAAQKWVEDGKAEFIGYTRELDNIAFGILTVFASKSKPGYTCHFRDTDQDGVVDSARALRAIPSEARAVASRENGKKGGRPKKAQ